MLNDFQIFSLQDVDDGGAGIAIWMLLKMIGNWQNWDPVQRSTLLGIHYDQ